MQQRLRAAYGLFVQTAREHGEPEMDGAAGLPTASFDAVEQFLTGTNDHLRGGGWGGGAKVGDEIGDGDVGFVADGGNNRDRRIGDGVRDGSLH